MNVLQKFLVSSAILVCLALQLHAAKPAAEHHQPNLVVFVSDDLGRLETSVYGSKEVRTPTMDRLAKSGMTFENAYVASPSCCPNRFSLLTGLMPARHGAHPNHSQVKPGTKFLTSQLKALGYTVISFGKVAHGRNPIPGCEFNSLKPREMSVDVKRWFSNNEVKGPVCLMVGDRRPHVPWIDQLDYDPQSITLPHFLVDTKETREHWARYLTDITGMDAEMDRIWKIAQKEFGNDFVFLFTSDHGGQWPFGKWNLYDSGTRIPLMMSWPGKIKPGTRTDAMVSWVDLLPTLIDIGGGQPGDKIDGRSFKNVLLGKTDSHREKIFTTHTGDSNKNIYPIRSVRIGNFKYIRNLRPDARHTNHSDLDRKDGAGAYWDSWEAAAKQDPKAAAIIMKYYGRPAEEFFDLSNDPLEQNNLIHADKYQKEIESFRQELVDWAKSQGDDLKPHREPYLLSDPIPEVETIPPKKKPRKTGTAKKQS